MYITRLKTTLFYISILILIFPTILNAAHPAAAGAGELAQLAQPAVGGKRHGAQLHCEPAIKKQKAELDNDKSENEYQLQKNRLLLSEFTNSLDLEHLDIVFTKAVKNDVEFVQFALNNKEAKTIFNREMNLNAMSCTLALFPWRKH